jgi:hypothetical protein
MGNSPLSLPSQALGRYYVYLIEPYTLRGKDGIEIDFMCLSMIYPAFSWLEIVELPVNTDSATHGYRGAKWPKDS